ncbi:hypothetical protein FACS189460_5160 [Deltaproteobacteria bacterium]|nr:hypothetical protein FACS189460_5160 [Deltaproteobacteria bacterium]
MRIIAGLLFFLLLFPGAVFAYEVVHPFEEFGNLPVYSENQSLGFTISDLAFSISVFFKARTYVFKDRSLPPASGDYLELLNDARRAVIIYHDCYEGGCNEIPLLVFSCDIKINICENPKFTIRGEEVSFREFLRRGNFDLGN